jgi:hypothetical protein
MITVHQLIFLIYSFLFPHIKKRIYILTLQRLKDLAFRLLLIIYQFNWYTYILFIHFTSFFVHQSINTSWTKETASLS